jgi:hypothetical protein
MTAALNAGWWMQSLEPRRWVNQYPPPRITSLWQLHAAFGPRSCFTRQRSSRHFLEPQWRQAGGRMYVASLRAKVWRPSHFEHLHCMDHLAE